MAGRGEPAEGFEQRVRADFAKQRFMATLGAELRSVQPGDVVIELIPRPELTQQNGYAHAGVIASIADSACGYAAYTLMPADSDVLSVEFKLNLLSPATGDRLIARARVVRAGRTITVCQADVYALRSTSERHVATMTATMMRVIRSEKSL
jgi:uncharacterized protein (TIGR00369 family)